jgi:hypothetical protein
MDGLFLLISFTLVCTSAALIIILWRYSRQTGNTQRFIKYIAAVEGNPSAPDLDKLQQNLTNPDFKRIAETFKANLIAKQQIQSRVIGDFYIQRLNTLDALPQPYSRSALATTLSVIEQSHEVFGYSNPGEVLCGDFFQCYPIGPHHDILAAASAAGLGSESGIMAIVVHSMLRTFFPEHSASQSAWLNLRSEYLSKQASTMLSSMNDALCSLDYCGHFARFQLLIIDRRDGSCMLADAGGLGAELFSPEISAMQSLRMSAQNVSPSLGAVDPQIYEQLGRNITFPVHTLHLDEQSKIFLIPDRLCESRRILKDSNGQILSSSEMMKRSGLSQHEIEHWLQNRCSNGEPEIVLNEATITETFDVALNRIPGILNAAGNRTGYTLTKQLDVIQTKDYYFDFSKLDGSVRAMVLAVLAVEKIFRLEPNPKQTETHIGVDKNIDEVLRCCFADYHLFFRFPIEKEDPFNNFYSGLIEDPQELNLAIIGYHLKEFQNPAEPDSAAEADAKAKSQYRPSDPQEKEEELEYLEAVEEDERGDLEPLVAVEESALVEVEPLEEVEMEELDDNKWR